jgi:tetratricopeptide (TPR) repeat protein
MSNKLLDRVTGSLMSAGWRGGWLRALRRAQSSTDETATLERRRLERLRYHLGRGRRARDDGQYARGAAEARKAVRLNPQHAWALALLGQCLSRQPGPDLAGARRALERAQALDPKNGYFVRLLLDVLDMQGDTPARADALAWAWWSGAPVERWLPDGPPIRRPAPAASARETARPVASPAASPTERRTRGSGLVTGRQPVGA